MVQYRKGRNSYGRPFDFDDDGEVSEEEEEEAFLLFMDDDDEEKGGSAGKGGCLSMVLLFAGITAAIVSFPFLV